MAISKIRPRHASEGRSIAAVLKDRIDYDKNPDKTKGGLLVSSYQCSADTAWQEFALSKQIYEAETGRKRDPEKDVISYLIIQSFKPGEISPEDANKLGYQLALVSANSRSVGSCAPMGSSPDKILSSTDEINNSFKLAVCNFSNSIGSPPVVLGNTSDIVPSLLLNFNKKPPRFLPICRNVQPGLLKD